MSIKFKNKYEKYAYEISCDLEEYAADNIIRYNGVEYNLRDVEYISWEDSCDEGSYYIINEEKVEEYAVEYIPLFRHLYEEDLDRKYIVNEDKTYRAVRIKINESPAIYIDTLSEKIEIHHGKLEDEIDTWYLPEHIVYEIDDIYEGHYNWSLES